MTHNEKLLWFIGLTIVVGLATWLLVETLRYQVRMRKLRQEELNERRAPVQKDLWPWPPRNKYQRGEWGGPTEALNRFLRSLKIEDAKKRNAARFS